MLEGRSRGPTFVIAYLVSKAGWTLKNAYEAVENARVLPLTVNNGFKLALMQWETDITATQSVNLITMRSRRSSDGSSSLMQVD